MYCTREEYVLPWQRENGGKADQQEKIERGLEGKKSGGEAGSGTREGTNLGSGRQGRRVSCRAELPRVLHLGRRMTRRTPTWSEQLPPGRPLSLPGGERGKGGPPESYRKR